MVRSMGCPQHLIGDVVQDMYIKLNGIKNSERLMYSESEVNHFYVYLTLRSVFLDNIKRQGQYVLSEDADYSFLSTDANIESDEAWERLYKMVSDEINGFGPYGAKLCFSYFKTDKSIREIASESGISITSIFHSQKQYRDMLNEKFKEDYEDLKNGDYNKIKTT